MSDKETPLSVEQSLMEQHGGEASMWTDEELEANIVVDEDDLFGLAPKDESEEEEGAEETDEDDSEESDEESTEEEGGEEEAEEDDVDWSEVTETLKEEKSNLNKALHAERAKKNELNQKIADLEARLQVASANSYKEQFEKVMAQIEELDLGDIIKVDKPQDIDPRLQLLLQQQEAAQKQQAQIQQINTMQTLVSEQLAQFSNINPESNEQGVILGRLIMSDVSNGADMESAVASSLATLDALLGKTTKTAKATRTPVVKPKAKPVKAASHTKKAMSPNQRAMNKGAATGDFKDLFKQMGQRMAGEN